MRRLMFIFLPSRLRLSHNPSQSLRNTRINPRHQPRPALKNLKPFLYERTSLRVQRTIRVRLDEQAAYRDQHISQRQLRVPIALQRLDAHAARLRIDIWMEDWRSEVCRWWVLWV
jgi:hypothetical protein